MTADYDNITTTLMRKAEVPKHVLELLDALLTCIDHYDDTATDGAIQSQRDDMTRESMVILYNETMGAWLPPEYAELLHIEAGQLIDASGSIGPVSMALANLNGNGWAGIEGEPDEFSRLIAAARCLRTEPGDSNPEYDRALVELIVNATPGCSDDLDREAIEKAVLS